MSKWKPIDQNQTTNSTLTVHKTFNLDSSSYGHNFIKFKSGSSTEFESNDSGSYWDSNRKNFYLSGSQFHFTSYSSSYNAGNKFGKLIYTLAGKHGTNPTYLHKFHSTGSTLSISQYYFGDEIQKGSFKLTDNSHPSGTVVIVDDGYGNLYAPSASVSSSNTSLSSSDNYVGNIFYSLGIINITETGSFGPSDSSADISYSNVGFGTDGGIGSGSYEIEFNSTHVINSKEYYLKVEKGDFNFTTNPTIRRFGTEFGTQASISLFSSPHMRDDILSSSLSGSWGPMMTAIGFYVTASDGTIDDRPILIAKYPQPIMMRRDIDIIFKIRIDI